MDTDTNSEDDDITDSAMVDEFNSEENSSSGPVDLKKGSGSEDDDITDSVKVDEFNSERNSSAGHVKFKKGQWSNEEDAILKAYVEKHGQGNWNAVQTFTGLLRCGKSCRLRWGNHLRPYLKKGPFSPEEERKVIELHAKFGNKWARMALELPGRTDNEIKNFWNTRCKRLRRAGLPIYPPDVIVENQTEKQQSPETPPISNGSSPTILRYPADAGYHDIEVFKIPNNPILRSHSSPAFLDDPLLNMLPQVLHPNPSYSLGNMFPAIHPQGPVPAHNSNYMSVPLNPQDLGGYGTFSNNICPSIGLSDQVQESVFPYNGLTSGSFTAQSNRVPGLEDVRLPPHEVSTVNGLYPISDDPAPSCNASTHADINQYSFIEPCYESTSLELPSIQISDSDLSFMGNILPPEAGLSTLQSQESIDPAITMADGFINDPLETYSQHDDLQDSAPNVPVSVDDFQLVESNDDVLLAGTDLVPCPTFMDSYQVDILAENEWFDGSGQEYALLDLAMSAFINDEDY